MLILAFVGIIAALGLAAYALFDQLEEKSTIRASLRQLEGYEVENLRDRELLVPVQQRAVAPRHRFATRFL